MMKVKERETKNIIGKRSMVQEEREFHNTFMVSRSMTFHSKTDFKGSKMKKTLKKCLKKQLQVK